jgi:peroxiredoxin
MGRIMNKLKRLAMYAALVYAQIVTPAHAALKVGDQAPDFTVQASLGGKQFTFSLGDALKLGPVVLYFYPAAFTHGCTIEAHEFAEATDHFKALGATVIGISHDTIDTLDKFSVSECRSKFAVAADPDAAVIKAYDAALATHAGFADRISYVITPDRSVLYVYAAMNPSKHVANTLQALKQWHAKNQK